MDQITVGTLVGATIGASALVNVLQNVPFMDVLTSLNGGAGAGLGYVAGVYVAHNLIKDDNKTISTLVPIAGAIAVPVLIGGDSFDETALMLGVGAAAGSYLEKFMNKDL